MSTRATLALALLFASAASAELRPYRTELRPRIVRDDSVVFRLLPTVAASDECTGAALTGTRGEAVTVTRASSGYCTKSDGTLVSIGANLPRVESAGLLVEATATNVVLQSQTLDNASWTKTSAVVAAPTVTANTADVTDPTGANGAEKIAYPAVLNAGEASIVTQGVLTTAQAYDASVYLRTLSGTATVYLFWQDNVPVYRASTACSVTTAWSRCAVQGSLANATTNLGIGVDLRAGSGQTGKAAQTIYAWGVQFEAGSFATSYIATAGTTVARSADIVSTANKLTDGNAYCLGATVRPLSTFSDGAFHNLLTLGPDGSANSTTLQVNSTNTLRIYVFDNSALSKVYGSSSAPGTAEARVVGCNNAGTLTLYRDGTALSGSVTGTGTGVVASQPGTLYLGHNSGTSTLNGWIRDVRECKALGGCL